MNSSQLVLIRHGQSEWNKANRFTGWVDVELSDQGEKEALTAGEALKNQKIYFDYAFSSALTRAIQTLDIVLKQMNLTSVPVTKAWQLNERHYGALQGQNRLDAIKKYGKDQVYKWRRSFEVPPPPMLQNELIEQNELYKGLKQVPNGESLKDTQNRVPPFNELYKGLKQVPNGESLKDTQNRVLPFWEDSIKPHIQNGNSVLITAHGNSLRSLIKKLENVSDKDIFSLDIKTGQPLIYHMDKNAKVFSKEILKFKKK